MTDNATKIPIAIVDDRLELRRDTVSRLLETGTIEVLFEAENGTDFLRKMAQRQGFRQPKVVLMDIEMPYKDGIATVAEATPQYPHTDFLMLTVFEDDDKIFDALKAGAVGYLLKDEKTENIVRAIEEIVLLGGAPMSPRIARKTMQFLMNGKKSTDSPESVLTDREIEVLKLLVEGNDYKEIAEKHDISPNTARKHIANIYKKLHVTSRAQVVGLVHKKKWF